MSCAIYGRDNNLLNKPSLERFKSLAKEENKLLFLQKQAKLRIYRMTPKYKFGYQIARNNEYEHALSISKHNDNKKWAEAIKLEIDQQHDYEARKDMGKGSSKKAHEKIRVHFVFDIKNDRLHKSRLVADINLTDVPLSSVYSGVVSPRGIGLILFLAKLNKLDS